AYLCKKGSGLAQFLGNILLAAAPLLMRLLSVLGTAAMFMVGGGIVVHGIPAIHHWIEHIAIGTEPLGWLTTTLLSALAGIIIGAIVLVAVNLVGKLAGRQGQKG